MKRYFLVGLAFLLPIVLTLMIANFAINVLTAPFLGLVKSIFSYSGLQDKYLSFVTNEQLMNVIAKVLILITLFLVTVLIGFMARVFVLHAFIRFGDYLIHKIPFVNKIYKALQDVISTLFASDKPSFSKVVLVPFPKSGTRSIGFVTNESLPEGSDANQADLISVFVPGTPNPTVGFVFLFKREQLIFLDMKVDEALKFVVSCGVILNKR
jgi:uncharacterized membrane protein